MQSSRRRHPPRRPRRPTQGRSPARRELAAGPISPSPSRRRPSRSRLATQSADEILAAARARIQKRAAATARTQPAILHDAPPAPPRSRPSRLLWPMDGDPAIETVDPVQAKSLTAAIEAAMASSHARKCRAAPAVDRVTLRQPIGSSRCGRPQLRLPAGRGPPGARNLDATARASAATGAGAAAPPALARGAAAVSGPAAAAQRGPPTPAAAAAAPGRLANRSRAFPIGPHARPGRNRASAAPARGPRSPMAATANFLPPPHHAPERARVAAGLCSTARGVPGEKGC